MRLPAFLQPRILRQVMRALISPPFKKRFPEEPFEPPESFRGRPRFHEAGCIGCGACAEVCPPKCIELIDDVECSPPKRRLVQHLDACIWCGQCARYCPTGEGIQLSHEFDCTGFAPADFEETVEKELVLCEVCGDVIAPLDQLRRLGNELGPLAYANPTLTMIMGRDLGIVDPALKSADGELLRSDRLAVQCPRCRRKTAWSV